MAPWLNPQHSPTSRYEDDEGPTWPLVVPRFGGTRALLHLRPWSNMAPLEIRMHLGTLAETPVKLLPFFHVCFGSRVSNSLGHCFHWRPGADITTSFQHKSQPSDRNQGQTVTKWGSQIFLLDNTKDETEKDLWALWTPRSHGGVFKNAKKNKHTSLQRPEQYLADQPFFLLVGADVKGKLSFTCQGKLLRYMQAAKSDPSFWSVVRLLYPNPYHHGTSWIQLSNTNRYCIMVPKKRWAKITPGPFPQMEVWCSNKQNLDMFSCLWLSLL